MEMERFQTISPQRAKQIMDSEPDCMILDVREVEEYVTGHVENAIPFTLGQIDAEFAAECIPSKETRLLVYCRSGRRSRKACKILWKLGYHNLFDFGGVESWPYGLAW